MDPKKLMWILAGIGSIVGAYIPSLWGDSLFSMASVVGSGIGTILGVWLVFKISGY